LTAELKQVNDSLRRAEDALSTAERDGTFDVQALELTRALLRRKQQRSQLQHQLDEMFGG
jgi:hypothetical protein